MLSLKSLFVIVLLGLSAAVCLAGGGVGTGMAARASRGQAAAEEAPRIKPEEVRELLKQNKAVLVDVRGEAAYKDAHIKGALNIPYADVRERAKELPRDKMIIMYCS